MGVKILRDKIEGGRFFRPFLFKFNSMKPQKDKLHKITVGKQLEKQVEQGFFDGRFVQRVKKAYNCLGYFFLIETQDFCFLLRVFS
jgi:hypothetical protein